jgi:hypothetical protein
LSRSFAASLGALAMGLVVLRGAIHGELAANVAQEAIVALLLFACVGAVAGWICDYLVRQSLEGLFRKRVEWYRQGLIDAGYIEAETPSDV